MPIVRSSACHRCVARGCCACQDMPGVLITPFLGGVAETLRLNMALLGQTRLALSGQDDQKSRIYQYFTTPQFHEWMATIAEQFQQMQADLTREKAAMNRTWAKREKQIETIVSSAAKFSGELQALYGPALLQLRHLSLTSDL